MQLHRQDSHHISHPIIRPRTKQIQTASGRGSLGPLHHWRESSYQLQILRGTQGRSFMAVRIWNLIHIFQLICNSSSWADEHICRLDDCMLAYRMIVSTMAMRWCKSISRHRTRFELKGWIVTRRLLWASVRPGCQQEKCVI